VIKAAGSKPAFNILSISPKEVSVYEIRTGLWFLNVETQLHVYLLGSSSTFAGTAHNLAFSRTC
jgi:hypothetical protein